MIPFEAFGFLFFPVAMFIASAAVGFALNRREAISCTFHERCLQLEGYLNSHSSSLAKIVEGHIDMGIGMLEQRTQNFDAPISVSLFRQLLQPIADTQEIASNNTAEDRKTHADVELGNQVSSSWIKMNNSTQHPITQTLSEDRIQPVNDAHNNNSSATDTLPAFKIELKRLSYDPVRIPRFDTEGWLLVTNPDSIQWQSKNLQVLVKAIVRRGPKFNVKILYTPSNNLLPP